MPKNPTDLSLEILEKVDGFYSKSFEELSNFYSESFSYLFSYAAGFGVFALFVLGLFFEGQRRSLKKRSKESEKRINDLKNHYEKKLLQELESLREQFAEDRKSLKKDIWISEAKSFLFQGVSTKDLGVRLTFNGLALNAALKSEEDGMISAVLDVILVNLKSSDKSSFEGGAFQYSLEKLLQLKKSGSGFVVSIINQIEEEFKKAKERK